MNKKIIPIALAVLISLAVFVSAASIDNLRIDEPAGEITNRDTVVIKYSITNNEPSDLQNCVIKDTVNDRVYSWCEGECRDLDQGFKSGSTIEGSWADSARSEDYLQLGENVFEVSLECDGENIKEELVFEIVESDNPEIEFELSDFQVSIDDGDVQSLSFSITNNGPVDFEYDTVSYSILVEDRSGERLGSTGSFIDYREGVLEEGETEVINFENIESLQNMLRSREVVLTLILDDVNGLENYILKDTSVTELTEEVTLGEEVQLEPGEVAVWYNLIEGWNLVWGLQNPEQIVDESKKSSIQAIYGLEPGASEYTLTYPNGNADSLLQTSAYWVYSNENIALQYIVNNSVKNTQLKAGWSLIGITPEMADKPFSNIVGNCDFEKIYSFDTEDNIYSSNLAEDTTFLNNEFEEQYVGIGLLVKSSSDCTLNLGSVSPPPIPN